MKFLITGGCGFIGFHIGRSLLDHGHQVVLYDVTYPDEDWDERLLVAFKCQLVEQIVTSSGLIEFIKGFHCTTFFEGFDVKLSSYFLISVAELDC
jgi:nucleoside-diphosphate-sugar epimerase